MSHISLLSLQEEEESRVPLFADHESISQLLDECRAVSGGREQPIRTRSRFMSLDMTSSDPSSAPSTNLRRTLSNPRRLHHHDHPSPLGLSPLASASSSSKEKVAMEQVWVEDESGSPEDSKRLSRSAETNLGELERPTHSTTAHRLLRRHNSSREVDRRRLHSNVHRRSGKGQYSSAETLSTFGSGIREPAELGERSSSLNDVSTQADPLDAAEALPIPVIGIEEASDQDEDVGAPINGEARVWGSSSHPCLSPPPLSFMNPQLAHRLSCPQEGSASSLSTRTASDSDASLSGSEFKKYVGEPGERKVRKSSLRKKSRPHDPNKRVQLSLDCVEEEMPLHSTSSWKFKRRDLQDRIHMKMGGEEESEEESAMDGRKDKLSNDFLDGGFRPDSRRHTAQESFPINTKRAHAPHELFVQLNSWQYNHNQYEEGFIEKIWKEKARWIKFEEDWEDGSERWGKPHVASLTFNSLPQLRKGLENGLVLLDCGKSTLTGVFDAILERLEKEHDMGRNDRMLISKMLRASISGMAPDEPTGIVRGTLRRLSTIADFTHHRSTNQQQNQHNSVTLTTSRSMSAMDGDAFKNGNGHTDLQDAKIPAISQIKAENRKSQDRSSSSINRSTSSAINRSSSSATLLHPQHRGDGIIRKIPPEAEGALVMVAQEEYLEQPYMALVRMDETLKTDGFMEVPMPLRYLFFIAGPPIPTLDYHEVSRALATLFSDEVFRNIAYSALSQKDILAGINEFLNDTMVLPPGDWDRELLLPITRIQKKEQEKVRRRRKTLNLKEEDTKALKQLVTEEKIQRNPLQRTGYLFGGLYYDIRRRYPHYLSDILDSLNLTCLISFIFLYFACLSPAITFGGILGEMTHGLMGVSEMMISTSINGICFALFSGQPLLIIGPTGPVLVFEESILLFTKQMDIELLPFRAWIGIWTFLIATICVAVEGSVLIRHFTNFTEEVFALLISIIFLYETHHGLKYIACQNPLQETYCVGNYTTAHPYLFPYGDELGMNSTVADIYVPHTEINFLIGMDPTRSPVTSPVDSHDSSYHHDYVTLHHSSNDSHHSNDTHGHHSNDTHGAHDEHHDDHGAHGCYVPEGWDPKPNTTLMSIILTFGTFFIAFFIRRVRNSKLLGRTSRRAFGDVGIAIAIAIMVTVSYFTPNVYLQKLDIGNGFNPTDPEQRGWYINPMGMNEPMPFMGIMGAAVPAFLVFILLYMETLLTGVILSKKELKLKKGTGFHLDMFIMGVLTLTSGLFGLPWMCAATVRTVSHVASLGVMSRTDAPGVKPHLDHIKDQRMTNFLVSLCIGLSIYMAPLLREVPIAVLLGVFLYLGLCYISGLQVIERIKIFFMPSKHHPDTKYVRMVKAWKIHLFTLIQLICLTSIWMVKTSIIAITFPFFFILMIAIRRLMRFIYTDQELEALDGHDSEEGDHHEKESNDITPVPV